MNLLIFGLGYTGQAILDAARARGWSAHGTSRAGRDGTIPFDAADRAIAAATHVLTTAAPNPTDPILDRYEAALAAAPGLVWAGYMSTTAVYGNRDGGWVDEDTAPAPSQARGERRLAAEQAWSRLPVAIDIFRIAGIYGPGRSALDELRAGHARRVAKPGHLFGRIHRDDIVHAVIAAMAQVRPPGVRILNLADNEPAASADVIAEAAALLGMQPPPAVPFDEAARHMSDMARSFWAENRKVASRKTQAALGIAWRYPTYREGLRAILADQLGDRPAQHGEVGGP